MEKLIGRQLNQILNKEMGGPYWNGSLIDSQLEEILVHEGVNLEPSRDTEPMLPNQQYKLNSHKKDDYGGIATRPGALEDSFGIAPDMSPDTIETDQRFHLEDYK